MPAGLKISNKARHVLHGANFTAGVDYVQDNGAAMRATAAQGGIADEDSAAC